ncbi:MAG: prolipoprotein diacylglyceryl transferase [Verrucomicrobia bacterium]|nr:prolipoprotein diacylglyceryl transferase [Verrucomicrobiota bacterium]
MHPTAFNLGPLPIHWYGVMVALAFLVGLWTAARRAPQAGIHGERIMDLGPWLILGAIVGARILYVVSYWQESFAGEPFWEIFMVQRGGLVYYGGLIGASLAFILYARMRRLEMWKLADVLAPSIALGYVFGRIGCLLNGCCFGRACELPWAIKFPVGHETAGVAVHPTQIYDSLLNLALYAGLAWLHRRKKFDGQVFALYLVGYAITRSTVELFRGDYSPEHLRGGLTPAHWVSIGIFLTGVIFYLVLRQPSEATNSKK